MLTTLDSLFFVHSHRDLKISVIIYWQHKLLWVRILKLAKTCTAAACAHAYNACEFKGITTRQDHIAFLIWIVLSCFTFFLHSTAVQTEKPNIWDDVKLAHLVRVRDCQSRGRRFVSGKTPKKPRAQIYIGLSYIDPQAKVLNYCFK